MLHASNDGFLFSLMNILRGNQVNPASVSDALRLLCHTAGYAHGLVYEADLSGWFCLTASLLASPILIPTRLDPETVTAQHHAFPANQAVFYLTAGAEQMPEHRQLLRDYAAASMAAAPIHDDSGALYGFVLLLSETPMPPPADQDRDMLSAGLSVLVRYLGMRMYQRKFEQAQVTMGSILDNTGIDIYVNDFYTHEILYVNRSMAAPYGGREKFMGEKCWKTLFPGQGGPCEFCPQHKLIDADGLPTKVYTWDYQRPFDGSWFRVFSAAFRWVDGRLAHVVSSADITDNKRNEALVENMANYDQLTKLPNRRMLVKDCEERIDHADTTVQGYVLFFDIDGFKPINDTLGHDAGDEFLIQLGAFFSGIPLLKNAIYRNGGDEFVALIDGDTLTKANIISLAHFIHERFTKKWSLKKGDIFCNISIGVACYPEDGVTAEELLQKADMAMYRVKKSGGGNLCFGCELEDPHIKHKTEPNL